MKLRPQRVDDVFFSFCAILFVSNVHRNKPVSKNHQILIFEPAGLGAVTPHECVPIETNF